MEKTRRRGKCWRKELKKPLSERDLQEKHEEPIRRLSIERDGGNCSDFPSGECGGQESKARMERMESRSHPGAEEAGQSQTGSAALGETGAATDRACDPQGAHTAFSHLVVCRHAWHRDEHKHIGEHICHALAPDLLGRGRTHVWWAEGPPLRFQDLRRVAPLRELAR